MSPANNTKTSLQFALEKSEYFILVKRIDMPCDDKRSGRNLRLAKHFLKSLEDKNSSEHEDDMVEILHHLIHLCHISLKGGKVLHLSAGYDDSAFCG